MKVLSKQKTKGKLLLAFTIALLSIVFPSNSMTRDNKVYAVTFENETTKGKKSWNRNHQDYNKWYEPVKSYLYKRADGTYNRVECIDGYLYSEIYSAGYQYISKKKVKLELARFGGVYITEDAYFVVEGQDNEKAESGRTEFRIIKYDKNWNKLASKDLKDANTAVPFDAGSCRFARDNDILYIRTCHEMYNGHQASVMLQVNMSDCSIITANYDVANSGYGYISHSFNQFVADKDGVLYACDHGDAYERGITMMRYDNLAPGTKTFNNKVTAVVSMPFAGEIGDNDTNAALGGFAVSDTHAVAVGSSELQGKDTGKNIFVTTVATDNFSKNGSTFAWITNYDWYGNRLVSNPQMVEINSNKYLVMWGEFKFYGGGRTVFDRMCYVFLDGTGRMISNIASICAPLSDCQPIVDGDCAVWYVTGGSSPVFYRLPLDGSDIPPAKVNTKFTRGGIIYKVTKSSRTSAKVSVAGYNKQKMSKDVYLSDGLMYNGYFYSVTAIAPKAFRKCTKIREITIPASVTSIGKQAFEGCKNLKSLEVEYEKYTAKKIGKNAFKGVKKNICVTVPEKKLGAYKKLFRKRGMKADADFYRKHRVWY